MKQRIKVCWITNAPSPYKVDLMNLLSDELEITVLFEDREDQENSREKSWYGKNFKFNAEYLGYTANFKLLKKLAKDYDCLINGDYSKPICMIATELFRAYKKLVIMQVDGGIAQDRGFILNKLMSLIMQRNHVFLSSGKETDKYLFYYGVKNDQIFHYHFSSYFKKDIENNIKLKEDKKKLKQDDKIIIFSVGQQIHRKGYDVLAKACIDLPSHVKVVIAGGVPDKETAEIIQQYDIQNIEFIGFKSKTELYDYFAVSDIFVLPTRYDIWGLVINEAMSFALPIVSTNKCVAAMEFNSKERNGFIVETENPEQLHIALLKLVKDRNLREEYGKNSLKLIENYSLEQMAEDFLSVIDKMCKKED